MQSPALVPRNVHDCEEIHISGRSQSSGQGGSRQYDREKLLTELHAKLGEHVIDERLERQAGSCMTPGSAVEGAWPSMQPSNGSTAND